MVVTAADVMTSDVVTTEPTASLTDVVELMMEKRVSSVPVCTADGSLSGIISESDVVRPFRQSARRKRERWLTMIADGGAFSDDFLECVREQRRPAGDIMNRHMITARGDTKLDELADLMLEHGVKQIPIVADGKLIGIVSRSDLLRSIAKRTVDATPP